MFLPHTDVYPVYSSRFKSIGFRKHFLCMKTSQAFSNKCIRHTQGLCQNSKIVAAKVIRMRMENIAYLLKLDPSIKIVHYFRDPRGTLLSRSGGVRKKVHYMTDSAKSLCSQMMQDIYVRKQLEKIYPHNFYVLKYEDLAKEPHDYTKRLYKYFNLKVPDMVNNWIWNNTHSGGKSKETKDFLGTSRINSTATAYAWKEKLPPLVISNISQTCHNFLLEMRYIHQ